MLQETTNILSEKPQMTESVGGSGTMPEAHPYYTGSVPESSRNYRAFCQKAPEPSSTRIREAVTGSETIRT